VWSYAHSVAWLFPELERSARRIEYTLEVDAAGSQPIRSQRIFGLEATEGKGLEFAHPAVDGQMGSLLRLHREWRFSGDDAFLKECWPAAVRSMDFALREWDTDKDGVLDARMHNTYDIFFYGAEPLGNIYFFLAALKAMAAMARHLGEAAAAKRYEEAWARSSAAIDKLLYNGEYYQQRLDDVDAHRYQFGAGVLSDQTLGQLHAHLNGLGYVLPEEHIRSAVAAVFRHNFRPDLLHHENLQRAYALGDEGGLVTASWPKGGAAAGSVHLQRRGVDRHRVPSGDPADLRGLRRGRAHRRPRRPCPPHRGVPQPVGRHRGRPPLRPIPRSMGSADRRERGPVRRDRPNAVVRSDRRRPLLLLDRDGVGRRDDRGR
jgi:hypothetical protein